MSGNGTVPLSHRLGTGTVGQSPVTAGREKDGSLPIGLKALARQVLSRGSGAAAATAAASSAAVAFGGERDTIRTHATSASDGGTPVAMPTVDPPLRRTEANFDERAAIIEFDGGAPRAWAEGLARLDASQPPEGLSRARWQQLVDDGGRFLDQWAEVAIARGWTPADVFGALPASPAAAGLSYWRRVWWWL